MKHSLFINLVLGFVLPLTLSTAAHALVFNHTVVCNIEQSNMKLRVSGGANVAPNTATIGFVGLNSHPAPFTVVAERSLDGVTTYTFRWSEEGVHYITDINIRAGEKYDGVIRSAANGEGRRLTCVKGSPFGPFPVATFGN